MEKGEQMNPARTLRRGEIDATETCYLDWKHLFKVILIGRAGVGKTALAGRFRDNVYIEDTKSTIGADFCVQSLRMPDPFADGAGPSRPLNPQGDVVKIQLWDTAGQEKFQSVVLNYYRGAHGVILTFALDKRQTFESTKQLFHRLKDVKLDEHCIGILVGNKSDLRMDRVVAYEEGEALAESWGWTYVETSAKDDPERTWDLFYDLTVSMYSCYSRFQGSTVPITKTPRGGMPIRVLASEADSPPLSDSGTECRC